MRALDDLRAYWSGQCQAIGGTVERGATIRLHAPQGGFPTTGILAFDGDEDAARNELEAWKHAGAPFSWTTEDDRHDLALHAAGLHPMPELILVEREVDDLGAPGHPVSWTEGAQDFAKVQMVAHGIPPWAEAPVVKGWQELRAAGICHLATVAIDHRLAGAGALHGGAGHAGMYAVGVLKDHRRTGIATSLLKARMRRAQEIGLTTAVAATTADGFAFCRSHGFEETGRVRQWVWFPGTEIGDGPRGNERK